jgi:nitrite reductase (NADH) large subunit
MAKERIVVIGCGLAGASVVQALLERAQPGALKIDVLSTEAQVAYDRFDLARVLSGSATAEQIVRYDSAWFGARGVQLHTSRQARYVDRFRRHVHAEDLVLPYDKLVLATGSGAYLPSIRNLLLADGKLHHGAFTFRSLSDCSALDSALSTMRRVAVLGGGPLGLALVSALRQRGAEVQLFHVGQRLMSGQLDETAGRILKAEVEALGAQVHFGRRARAIIGDGQLRGISFSDGTEHPCDAVVLATGFQPDTWLGFQCGLSVERGIVVDGHMRSIDDLNVYALGECAQWRASIHGTPEQIAEQARVVAEHLTTRHSEHRYLGQRSASLFRVAGLELATMGCPQSGDSDDVAQLSEPGRARYKRIVMRQGRLVSAILLGDLRQASNLSKLYDTAAPLSAEAQYELFDLCLPRKD